MAMSNKAGGPNYPVTTILLLRIKPVDVCAHMYHERYVNVQTNVGGNKWK